MATVILIVFVAIVAVLGGWWLKRERANQQKELINKGKLAAGKLDEVVLPKKKPVKRQRRKREGSFWDPTNVAPEVPSELMLEAWTKRAAELVDELMPKLAAYRQGKAEDEPAQAALKTAESELVSYYPADATSEMEARAWYDKLEARLKKYYEAKTAKDNSAGALRKLFNPARDAALRLKFLVGDAERWETYKAPESFHEKLEIAQVLVAALKGELQLENATLGFSVSDNFTKRRRRYDTGSVVLVDEEEAPGGYGWSNAWKSNTVKPADGLSGSGGITRKANDVDSPTAPGGRERSQRPWQNLNDKDFGSGFGNSGEPPRPKEDAEIVGRVKETLLDVLKHVAGVCDAIATAAHSYKAHRDAVQHPTLARPTKPVEDEVEAILTSASAWAKTAQSAHLQMHRDSKKLEEKLATMRAALAPLHELMGVLKDARIPQQDGIEKDVVSHAYEQLVKYVKPIPDQHKHLLGISAPYSPEAQDTQAQRDAASNLRNLMRKALFAIGQAEVAQANHAAAKAETLTQAEFNTPLLTQTSVSAFVNTHVRMLEIIGRNRQKTEVHGTKVRALEKQHGERVQQYKQAVGAVWKTHQTLIANKLEVSGPLEVTLRVATLFNSTYNK